MSFFKTIFITIFCLFQGGLQQRVDPWSPPHYPDPLPWPLNLLVMKACHVTLRATRACGTPSYMGRNLASPICLPTTET